MFYKKKIIISVYILHNLGIVRGIHVVKLQCPNSDYKLFADDLKLFRPISCKNDTLLLQVKIILQHLNAINVSHKRRGIYFDYVVSGTKLNRVNFI